MRNKFIIYTTYICILIIGVAIYLTILFTINNKQNNKLDTSYNNQNNNIQLEYNYQKKKVNNIQNEEEKSSELIDVNNKNTTYIIKVNVANVREAPSTDAKIINKYKLNDEVIIINQIGKWAELRGGGFIHIDLLSIKS